MRRMTEMFAKNMAMLMHGVNYELIRMRDDTHVSILHGETHAFIDYI